MAKKIKFGTQCDEAVLKAVKSRLAIDGGFLGDAVEEGLRLWVQSQGGAANVSGPAAPDPMAGLTVEESAIALGLVAGWRAKDAVVAGIVQLLKARISEKGYAGPS
jgi:hypothetical protein